MNSLDAWDAEPVSIEEIKKDIDACINLIMKAPPPKRLVSIYFNPSDAAKLLSAKQIEKVDGGLIAGFGISIFTRRCLDPGDGLLHFSDGSFEPMRFKLSRPNTALADGQ